MFYFEIQVVHSVSCGVDIVSTDGPKLLTNLTEFSVDNDPKVGVKRKAGALTDENQTCAVVNPLMGGTLNLKDVMYEEDKQPLQSGCACIACKHHTRSYIHHLLKANELLGMM